MTDMVDSIDMEILMHRDSHFGGNFDVMLDYYKQDGVGVVPDFEIEEIKKLQIMENELGQNLSEVYLPEMAKETVEEAKKLYQELRNVYEDENARKEGVLLSDLILSEEEYPQKEIDALIKEGGKAVPLLIHLISSQTFYDPLFPGYGRSPIFAAKCLAGIQDERAIPPLFEALGHENFFTDEEIILALASFGDLAKAFLLKRLAQEPFSKDNEQAAIALSGFTEDEEIASTSLKVLEKEETLRNPHFASYLIFACSDLTKSLERERFIALSKKKEISSSIKSEMMIVIKNWKETP